MKSSLIYYSAISIFFFLSCTGSKEKRNMESDIITVNLERRDNISTKDLFSDIQFRDRYSPQESCSTLRRQQRSLFL